MNICRFNSERFILYRKRRERKELGCRAGTKWGSTAGDGCLASGCGKMVTAFFIFYFYFFYLAGC